MYSVNCFDLGVKVSEMSSQIDKMLKFHKEGLVVDFLPDIRKNRKPDIIILRLWIDHFRRKKLPYVTTDNKLFYTLWVEDRAERADREKIKKELKAPLIEKMLNSDIPIIEICTKMVVCREYVGYVKKKLKDRGGYHGKR